MTRARKPHTAITWADLSSRVQLWGRMLCELCGGKAPRFEDALREAERRGAERMRRACFEAVARVEQAENGEGYGEIAEAALKVPLPGDEPEKEGR